MNLIRKLTYIFSLICACLYSSVSYSLDTSAHDLSAQLQQKVSPAIFSILADPEEVYTFKVAMKLTKPGNPAYEGSSEERALTAQQIADLKKILAQDDSYHFNVSKPCPFMPDTAFKFRKGSEDVFVYFSASCAQVKFVVEGKSIVLLDLVQPAQKALKSLLESID